MAESNELSVDEMINILFGRGFRFRYETQSEEASRNTREEHPAFLKKGIKLDFMPEPKWPKPLEDHLEMEDAIVEQWM